MAPVSGEENYDEVITSTSATKSRMSDTDTNNGAGLIFGLGRQIERNSHTHTLIKRAVLLLNNSSVHGTRTEICKTNCRRFSIPACVCNIGQTVAS